MNASQGTSNMTAEKAWDVVSLLKTSADFFKQKGIDDARLNVELLLSHVLKMRRFDLYLNFEQPITPSELQTFRDLCKRRMSGEPVQYILGEEEFFGLKFAVDKRVLIPRPETEQLVEQIISDAPKLSDGDSLRLLDIGTGSGCIAVALAKCIEHATLVAVDVSPDALNVAKRNAQTNDVAHKIEFRELDVLSATFAAQFSETFDVIVSNPPYIPEAEKATLQPEVRDHEPHLALFSKTGFEFYEKISSDARALLRDGGRLYFELHADGAEKTSEILTRNGFQDIQLLQDYSGMTRIAVAVKSA